MINTIRLYRKTAPSCSFFDYCIPGRLKVHPENKMIKMLQGSVLHYRKRRRQDIEFPQFCREEETRNYMKHVFSFPPSVTHNWLESKEPPGPPGLRRLG